MKLTERIVVDKQHCDACISLGIKPNQSTEAPHVCMYCGEEARCPAHRESNFFTQTLLLVGHTVSFRLCLDCYNKHLRTNSPKSRKAIVFKELYRVSQIFSRNKQTREQLFKIEQEYSKRLMLLATKHNIKL